MESRERREYVGRPRWRQSRLAEKVAEVMAQPLEGAYFFAQEANELLGQLRERCAALERGIKAIQENCKWRAFGLCDLDCNGRQFCDVRGLNSYYWQRVAAGELEYPWQEESCAL